VVRVDVAGVQSTWLIVQGGLGFDGWECLGCHAMVRLGFFVGL
jgi:hypothetical protein